MAENLSTKDQSTLLKEFESKKIRSRNIFVPGKGFTENGEALFNIELERFTGLYRLLTGDGRRLPRQGFHTFAFAAYKKSLDWLLGGLTAEEARQKLDPVFHLEVKVSCFLNCMLASIGQESNRPYIGRFTNAIDELSNEYDNMQKAKESELPNSISSYLTCVAYIEQYSPSATFYDGPAASISEANRVLSALNILEGIKQSGLTHLERIKSPLANLFDGLAIQKSLKGDSSDICLFSFLMMQVYRMVIPLISDQREFRFFEKTAGIEGFIAHVLHLPTDPMTLTKIKNGFKIINEMKAYVENRPSIDLCGMTSMTMALINKYKV